MSETSHTDTSKWPYIISTDTNNIGADKNNNDINKLTKKLKQQANTKATKATCISLKNAWKNIIASKATHISLKNTWITGAGTVTVMMAFKYGYNCDSHNI